MKPAIMSILDQFRSPKSVIDKRRDKYLDVQRNNRRNSEPNPASEDYSKLSSILLTELPVFLNSIAKAFDVPQVAANCRYYAGWADKNHGKVVEVNDAKFTYTR